MEIRIIDASPGDAELIASGIMVAVGESVCRGMAGDNHSLEDVKDIFKTLAMRDDTQYSWRNTRIAVDECGRKMGITVSYPGSDLRKLRWAFFRLANERLGWNLSDEEIENLPGETGEEEFYLDTLMTLPEFRRKGVATRLIEDAARKAASCGLPLGLLVDPDNPRARKLYDSIGFKEVGMRPFAGIEMHNLQLFNASDK